MTVYFVSNNLVIDNIFYETDESLEEKRITRVLSVEGEKAAVKVAKKIKADVIYSSSYASSVSSAKYYSKRWDLPININSFLNDTRVGDMENRNIKMLRFMQERDFDFKFKHGESLNEVSKRMNIAMDRIIKKCGNKDIVVFTQKSAIMGYLFDYLDKGFNYDDRLILSYHGKVILDDTFNDIDIIKVDREKGKIVNIEVIDCEE